MAGHHIEYAGFGQPAMRAGGTDADEADMIGMFGLQRVGEAGAQKCCHAAEIGALRDQRFGQGQRLAAGLAPHDGIAAPDNAAPLQRLRIDPLPAVSPWLRAAAPTRRRPRPPSTKDRRTHWKRKNTKK